jgi:hypothetical protein
VVKQSSSTPSALSSCTCCNNWYSTRAAATRFDARTGDCLQLWTSSRRGGALAYNHLTVLQGWVAA